jgi:hypothetical protein
VNQAGNDDLQQSNKGPKRAEKMSHSEGLNSIETALAYTEQQRQATATDMLLLRCCHDPDTKKRKETQKQIHITNLFKK